MSRDVCSARGFRRYYAHPDVRRRLAYTGQQPVPVRPEDYPEYVAEGLLERVVQRGEVYRPAD